MELRIVHEDLHNQIDHLESVLAKSKTIAEVLKKAPDLTLPNWYVGAGAIAQTVWNELHGYPLDHGLKDCDLVYFDLDISSETQNVYRQRSNELFQEGESFSFTRENSGVWTANHRGRYTKGAGEACKRPLQP